MFLAVLKWLQPAMKSTLLRRCPHSLSACLQGTGPEVAKVDDALEVAAKLAGLKL